MPSLKRLMRMAVAPFDFEEFLGHDGSAAKGRPGWQERGGAVGMLPCV
uniref:Uncharacterized protein n=1 Tax=Anguilla anguilla TaxID=7936 RepID=A0A0E9PBH9_ANGAN